MCDCCRAQQPGIRPAQGQARVTATVMSKDGSCRLTGASRYVSITMPAATFAVTLNRCAKGKEVAGLAWLSWSRIGGAFRVCRTSCALVARANLRRKSGTTNRTILRDYARRSRQNGFADGLFTPVTTRSRVFTASVRAADRPGHDKGLPYAIVWVSAGLIECVQWGFAVRNPSDGQPGPRVPT